MAMWHDDRDRMDAAIDEVAREMTAGAPAAAFKARVLARISGSRVERRWQWVLSPLAVAALVLIVLAVYRMRPAYRDRTFTTSAGVVQSAGNNQPPAERVQQRNDDVVAPRPLRSPARHDPGGRADAARPVADAMTPASDVVALAPPQLEIDSIDLEQLADPASLVIQRLEPTSIAVTPIGEGERP
jgi:hypothetical protein